MTIIIITPSATSILSSLVLSLVHNAAPVRALKDEETVVDAVKQGIPVRQAVECKED